MRRIQTYLALGAVLAVGTAVVSAARAAVDPYDAFRCERAYNDGDYLSALNICGPIAEAGHDESQVIMGVMHQNGQGVKRDYKEAALWYAKAAKQGNAQAQFNLGTLYRTAPVSRRTWSRPTPGTMWPTPTVIPRPPRRAIWSRNC